jgi:hypothetical protein
MHGNPTALRHKPKLAMFPLVRCLMFIALVCWPWTPRAVLMEPLTISALADQSELVVEGKVASKTSLRDETGRIYTRIELQVTEVWKGSISGSPFLIVQGGGVLGEEWSAVSGQVDYEPGEEVVAFLVRNHRGEGVTLGMAQGKFHVWKDPGTGVKYAANPFHGGGVARGKVGQSSHTHSGAGSVLLRVSEMKRLVKGGAR